jgi:hypothetical protein
MIKHWPLRIGFANFNNEMTDSHTHINIKKFVGRLGKCIMFEIQLRHTRFYIGWYYAKNKTNKETD